MSLLDVERHKNFVCALSKVVSTICRRKNTFIKCEDLRFSWDLNYFFCKISSEVIKNILGLGFFHRLCTWNCIK